MAAHRSDPKPACLCGCGRIVKAHHNRYYERKCIPKKINPPCVIDGCHRVSTGGAHGMCGAHHLRVRRYGNPHHVTSEADRRVLSRMAQPKLGQLKPHVYPKYLGRHLHRRVAEEKIGRALRRDEIVHHMDGNPHNNAPENLQVLPSQSVHARRHKFGERRRFSNRSC